MGPTDRLGELDDLLRKQLSMRGLHAPVREFLASQGISAQPGWIRIKKVIEAQREQAGFAEFLEAFSSFVRDAVLVSQKRVYLLSSDQFDPSSLYPLLPYAENSDYLSATPPKLDEEGGPFFLETRQFGSATIHTFLTSRPVHRTEPIDSDTLSAEMREEYRDAKIVARFDVDFRCYDHVVKVNGRALLLVDAPYGANRNVLSQDEANYGTQVAEKTGLALDAPVLRKQDRHIGRRAKRGSPPTYWPT